MKKLALIVTTAIVIGGSVMASHAATKAQCTTWSQKSDRQMGGCRASFLAKEMTNRRKSECCSYRLETIRTWEQCTAYFGPVDRKSLAQSKKEWGCG